MRRAFEPLHQVDRRPACFIDRREVSFDDMRDDIAGVNADPDVKLRIFQQLDTPHELDGCMTGHNGVVVVCVRRTKQRNQPVAAFLADDPAVATNCRAHGDQGRLEPGNRFFGIELRNQIGRTLQVGTEHGEEFSLASDTATRFGCGRARRMVGHNRAACRAKQVASSQRRRTDLARHPQLPPSTLFRLAKDHGRTSLYVVCRDRWAFCGQAMRWISGWEESEGT